MNVQQIYRPLWVSGRYSPEKSVAIAYNLIRGESFFFKSHSAHVIGSILALKRNKCIDIEKLALETGIHVSSIHEFAETLHEVGLISFSVLSEEEVRILQVKQGEYVKGQTRWTQQGEKETLVYETTSAEQAYSEALNDGKHVTSVMFELTYNCSAKCIHCFNDGAARESDETSKRNRKELTLNDYKRIIDELYSLGLYRVCLTGGDPFSKPEVWEILDYLYNKNIVFDIYTNGLSITHHVEKLCSLYPRLIGVSIYSADEAIHDKITRVNGSLKRTLQAVENIAYYGVPMAFKCVIFKTNVKSYHTVESLAKKHGAVLQYEVNLSNGVDGDTSIVNNLRLPPEVLEVVLLDKNISMYVGKELPDYGARNRDMETSPCLAASGTFNITPEGNLTPCCAFPASLGDLKEKTVEEILKTSKTLKLWQSLKVKDIDECGKHDKCTFCFLCIGNAYVEHGTPYKASSVNCFMAEVRYNLVCKLKNGQDPLNGLSILDKLNQMIIDSPVSFKKEAGENYREKRWE